MTESVCVCVCARVTECVCMCDGVKISLVGTACLTCQADKMLNWVESERARESEGESRMEGFL